MDNDLELQVIELGDDDVTKEVDIEQYLLYVACVEAEHLGYLEKGESQCLLPS